MNRYQTIQLRIHLRGVAVHSKGNTRSDTLHLQVLRLRGLVLTQYLELLIIILIIIMLYLHNYVYLILSLITYNEQVRTVNKS